MKYILIFSLLLFSGILIGQEEDFIGKKEANNKDLSLVLIHKNYGDKITLRWAPTRQDGWMKSQTNGFRIDRLKLNQDMEPLGNWDTLVTPIIKPYSIQKYKTEIAKAKDDNYLTAAAESLYGYQLEHKNAAPEGNLFDLADEYKDRFAICLLSADLSQKAAVSLGWSYTDTNVDSKFIYIYRVFVPGNDSLSYMMDNTIVAVKDDKLLEYPVVTELLEKEGQIDIVLDREKNDAYFSGYYFERSTDRGKTWVKLNSLPYVQPLTDQKGIGNVNSIIYRDEKLKNYTPYSYRVKGVTAFGELSKPSLIFKGMAKDRTPPLPPDRMKVVMNDKKQMEITWEYDSKPNDIRGYILGKSKRPYDPMEPLHEDELSPSMTSFIDDSPYEMASNYYTLFVLDTAGNISYSKSTFGSYIDDVPPSPPQNLSYTIDTLGMVKLKWDLGKEKDILGYHVYFSNSQKNFLHNATKTVLQDTIFRDTLDLRSLTENAFYRVTALDMNYNVSGYSDWIKVVKPDLVAPSAPLIVAHKATKNGINFEFKKSSSLDVVTYELLRSYDGKNWKRIKTIGAKNKSKHILDQKSLIKGVLYKYKLIAIDDAKNRSKSAYVYTARTHKPIPKGEITQFNVVYSKNKTLITWDFKGKKDDVVKLYRKSGETKLKLIRTYEASVKSGKDYTVKNDKSYTYRIQLESERGQVLDKSKEVKLKM